jgi:hypothetical protein
LTTDLGLGFARLLTYSRQDEVFQKEVRANWLRSGSILAFVFGSAVGAWFFVKLGYRGFLLPSLIAFYGMHQGRKAKISTHRLELIADEL